MSFVKQDADYDNLISGTVYAYDVRPDGMYITVAGNNDKPTIVAFDVEDIEALSNAIALFGRQVQQ
jgi:hypothetical protein